ncbi:hypothetical protein DCO48_10620 [Pseudomonas sp. SDI]|uniref:DUF3077 domain-containing protein n=1 Tax=Pseudomonas sp. SDI TaxID=2170734 RepID=UPI000DE5CE43|nr:DUF3077 domain-containing protein [Pseudomonas sp. SDI]PWB33109.1 hypothetical protein DCO48_10620 [Pseudomonas sp. SDI]
MIKIVPDPPLGNTLPTTAHATFGSCSGSHAPLFAVREGVDMEDALVHISVLVKAAYETNVQACEKAGDELRGLLWAGQHSLEMAKALTDAVLDGVEARQVKP